MALSQFVEYADVERPGIKLVSSKQVKTFLTDTSYGVVFYVVVHAISPNKILTTPRFRCKFALGTNNATDGFVFPIVTPLQGPVTSTDPTSGVRNREYPFISSLTYPDGSTATVPISVDRNSVSPLQTLEGTIYFEIPKTKAQRPFSQEIQIF